MRVAGGMSGMADSPDKPLAGRTALVTGSGKNIGRAIALGLAAAGADVAVLGKSDRQAVQHTAEDIRRAGGKSVAVLADIADEQSVAEAVRDIAAELGGPTILVNNAAVRRQTAFADMTFAEWRAITGVILDGAFLCARAAAPFMTEAGGGAIVNISGLGAFTGARGRVHVISAKMGLVGLTRALAVDLAGAGVRVNCIAPGKIATRRGESAGPPPVHPGADSPLVGKSGEPRDIASLAVFLCAPEAKYITGQTFHVNGGLFLS